MIGQVSINGPFSITMFIYQCQHYSIYIYIINWYHIISCQIISYHIISTLPISVDLYVIRVYPGTHIYRGIYSNTLIMVYMGVYIYTYIYVYIYTHTLYPTSHHFPMEKKHGPAVPKASALARRLPSSSALRRLSERTQAS